jgi:ATP:ADP antiporter, AAA family
MVEAITTDMDEQTTMFARIDMIAQIATLVAAVHHGPPDEEVGVAITLTVLPITVALLGFVGLAIFGTSRR